MKVLIIKGGFGDVYEPAWAKALNKIGHETIIFDCHQYTLPSLIGKLERRFLIGPSMRVIRKTSIEFAKKFKPDIIHLYQGHYHDANSVAELKKIAWVTGYHNDNPFSALEDGRHANRYKHLIKALPFYDSYHVYRNSNIQDVKNFGVNNVEMLMSYYIPEYDKPQPNMTSNLGADVIFAGHPEPDGREDYVEEIIQNDINFKLYGDSRFWKKILNIESFNKINEIKVLSTKDYRIAINSSKICLSFFSHWNRDTYTRRVFEIPAMCKFLMTTRTITMQELYEEDKEAVFFSSKEEMLDKIRFYLNNESKREKIERAGFQRCITSGYDICSRMKQWINDVEVWKKR